MALAARLTLAGAPAEDPEDFFGASLAMFDDTINLRRFFPPMSHGNSHTHLPLTVAVY